VVFVWLHCLVISHITTPTPSSRSCILHSTPPLHHTYYTTRLLLEPRPVHATRPHIALYMPPHHHIRDVRSPTVVTSCFPSLYTPLSPHPSPVRPPRPLVVGPGSHLPSFRSSHHAFVTPRAVICMHLLAWCSTDSSSLFSRLLVIEF